MTCEIPLPRALQKKFKSNAFAAELLMPANLVRDLLVHEGKAHLAEGPLIAFAAKRFKVSKEAMRYRLTNLGVLSPYPNE